jgi:hypothetical protein
MIESTNLCLVDGHQTPLQTIYFSLRVKKCHVHQAKWHSPRALQLYVLKLNFSNVFPEDTEIWRSVSAADCVRWTLYIEMTISSLVNVRFLACVSELSILDYVASFSGLSILDCPLGFLSLSFIRESSNVALESTHIYITIGKGRIRITLCKNKQITQ